MNLKIKLKPTPVLPEVGSIIIVSWLIKLSLKAWSSKNLATLTLIEDVGLKFSNLTNKREDKEYFFSKEVNSTIGVEPIKSKMDILTTLNIICKIN